jgi:hypothetical protein
MKKQLWLHPHEWAIVWQALHACHCSDHTRDTACVTVGKQEFYRLKGLVHPLSKAPEKVGE